MAQLVVRSTCRACTAALLFGAMFLAPTRADPPVAWEPERTTSPETVAQLRALQATVKQVVARVTPSTVALLVGPGSGSGVIVSEDGLVLTASHVIGRPGRSVRFVLADGTRVLGKTLGQNTKADSGMARITDPPPKGADWPGAKDGKWPAVPLGKGTELRKGQWVVALGHPGGPKAERPPCVRVGRFENYSRSDSSLRSDCTLVGGDSGGPLLDLNGRLVGIHSRIGLFLEYNMQVPTELYQAEWDRLLQGEMIGKTTRADLGLETDQGPGAPTVKLVAPDTPAARAGIKPGDVITEFEGEAVASAADLNLILNGLNPGDRVSLAIRRGPATLKLNFALGGATPAKDRKETKDR